MLDDLKLIHSRDGADMLGTAGKQWQWLAGSVTPAIPALPKHDQKFRSIIFYGENVAVTALEVARTWNAADMPLEIRLSSAIPAYVNNGTICIVADYGGQGVMARQALRKLQGRGAAVIVVTAGGPLAQEAKGQGAVVIELASGLLEQQAVVSMAVALEHVLAALADGSGHAAPAAVGAEDRLLAQESLRRFSDAWAPTVATARNRAKQLALELAGKSVVISGGPLMGPIARAWKVFLNRNAKHTAWCSSYPVEARDELAGWSKQPVIRPYAVVSLRSHLEGEGVRKRAELSDRLLSGMRPEPIIIEAEGGTIIEQSLYALCLGEHVSLYLSLLAGVDPAVSDTLAKFDKESQ